MSNAICVTPKYDVEHAAQLGINDDVVDPGSFTLEIMRSLSYATVTLLLSMQFQLAAASDRQCRIDSYDPKVCKCGTNLTSYPVAGVKNFHLIAVCGYQKMEWGEYGAFRFLGSVELSGEIRREDTTSLGDTMFFTLRESLQSKFPVYLWDIRFDDRARKKFGAPKVSDKRPCWVADTTIILRKLDVLEDSGSDNGGSFAIGYSVKKVDRFKQCVQ